MSTTWQNWARNVIARPDRIAHPRDTEEVADLVRRARDSRVRIKAYGAGHSFTPIAVTDGILVRFDRMTRILDIDPTSRQVRVQAGISLHMLNPRLEARDLALPNLGDVDPQSVAGAISTGTHGTGRKHHGIAAAVVSMQLVTGTGDVVEVDADHPWFDAARVGLGALGIITEVTLQCVPAFRLRAVEEPASLDDVLDDLPGLVDGHDHAEFYWFPHTDRALVKRNDRVGDDETGPVLGRLRHLVDDELLSNGVFEVVNRVGRHRPDWIPRINAISGQALSAREYVASSHEVFVSRRRVRFRESEFAMPLDALDDVIASLRHWFEQSAERISFPIEVRFLAAEDAWLSTAHGRDTCYVAVHQYHRSDPREYFAAAQEIFVHHDGRPHWGKMHTLDAGHLRTLYPRFDDFLAVRDEADPDRVLTNEYLERVLGQ